MKAKDLIQSTGSGAEKVWIYLFQGIGTIMFVAAIWEPVYTLFHIDREIVPMSKYQITFAAIGFALSFGGKSFGTIANNLGAMLSEKLKALLGG